MTGPVAREPQPGEPEHRPRWAEAAPHDRFNYDELEWSWMKHRAELYRLRARLGELVAAGNALAEALEYSETALGDDGLGAAERLDEAMTAWRRVAGR